MILDEIYRAFDLMDKGELKEALGLLDSLQVPSEAPEYFDYLSTYGYVYTAMKNYPEAIHSYEKYLEKAISGSDSLHEHRAYHQLCMVYREQKDYDQALCVLEKEGAIIEEKFPEDALVWSIHLYELGVINNHLGYKDKAEAALLKSLEYAIQTKDLVAQACAYRALGEMSKNLDYLNKARRLFEEAEDWIGSQEVEEIIASL